jgi:hypothetical protein
MVRFPVLLSLLLLVSSLHAAPAVSPELPLTGRDLTNAPYVQEAVSIASAGSHAFAVWSDQRRQMGFGSLFGARLAADGTVLDPNGILIDEDISDLPAVAWNGSEYVVVALDTAQTLYSWRIAADGTRRGTRRTLDNIDFPRIAGNGSEIAVGGLAGGQGVFALLASDGSIAGRSYMGDSNSIVVPVADGRSWVQFFDTTHCTSTNTCTAKLRMNRLGLSAPVELFAVKEFPMLSAAATGDGRFLLVWSNIEEDAARTRFTITVHYALVDRDGRVLTAPAELDKTAMLRSELTSQSMDPYYGPEPPAVAWDGRQFVVAWSWFEPKGTTEIRAARIGASGNRIDAAPLVVDRRQEVRADPRRKPQVAVTSSKVIFAWTLPQTGLSWKTADVVQRAVTSLDELAQTREPSVISTAGETQETIDLAAGDDSYMAAWIEGDSHATRVMTQLFPYAGTQTAPVQVSTSGLFAENPSVGYGGGVYLVAWREEEYAVGRFNSFDATAMRVLARRYDRAGRALDAAPLVLSREPYSSDDRSTFPHKTIGIASDGQQFLVAWGGVDDHRTRAARITNGGTVLDTTPLALSSPAYARRGAPNPVWTGSEFLVVWYENPTPTSNNGSPLPTLPHFASATRVSPNGQVASAAQIIETAASWEIGRTGFFAARNANEILVTWGIRRTAPSPTCTYAQRFDLAGKALDTQPATLACAGGGGWRDWNGDPQAHWYRDAWWIVHGNLGAEGGVFATKLGSTTRYPIADAAGRPIMMKSIVTPIGILVAYSRIDAASGHVRRIFVRRFSDTHARGRAVR